MDDSSDADTDGTSARSELGSMPRLPERAARVLTFLQLEYPRIGNLLQLEVQTQRNWFNIYITILAASIAVIGVIAADKPLSVLVIAVRVLSFVSFFLGCVVLVAAGQSKELVNFYSKQLGCMRHALVTQSTRSYRDVLANLRPGPYLYEKQTLPLCGRRGVDIGQEMPQLLLTVINSVVISLAGFIGCENSWTDRTGCTSLQWGLEEVIVGVVLLVCAFALQLLLWRRSRRKIRGPGDMDTLRWAQVSMKQTDFSYNSSESAS